MDYTVEDIDIQKDIERLGLTQPSGLSFLPENLKTASTDKDFIFTDNFVELNKIFKENEIDFDILGGDNNLYRTRKSNQIYLPAILFSLATVLENSALITISLNLISNYIFDLCKGSLHKKTVNVDFYIETKEKGKTKKISYKGDSEGFAKLEKIIKAMK
ncbi:hypothetical protein CLV62_10320 [Dysgonomonas alginatilytica]|uniref:Uncharacterized protein n=1 Tax=Dysgonomonas alginatilytica TaxID=1605892 RepID=A0A2V3PTW5_9BACT|nr:hypothetical protein [Dysgonomonas alginatilytica]PXV67347.1 hypothetical protein CLV62_10320 [Dysgonomonas alginatilytica]